jgi:16S rRNA (adenine1518-N6/adenine1519-N6)-dimethyltransferase
MSAPEGFESIPRLLKRYGLKPSKGLGQNFLADPAALRRVMEAAQVSDGDTVLEVGPGLGSLTRLLASQAARVVAVELDAGMLQALEDLLQPFENVELVHADILEVNLDSLFPQGDYLVVANIPYYITSALLRHLLEAPNPPNRLVLTVQKEVAERICADAGNLSLLALSVQVYGEPSIAARIPAGAFFPRPKVDSAVVRIDLHPQPLIPAERLDEFFQLIKAGFSQKRKTLRNALSAGMGWDKADTEAVLVRAGIDAQRRAQTLSMAEWGRLVGEYPSND